MGQRRYVESLDEIVFEERNKEYGAFVLRRNYDKRVTISLAVSLFLVLLVVGYPVLASYLDKSNSNRKLLKELTAVIETYKQEKDILPPPPPAEELTKTEVKQVKYTVFDVVDSVPDAQVILTDDDIKKMTTNADVASNNVVIVKEPEIGLVEKPKVDVPFLIVEEMPQYQGGDAALQKDLASKVVYPASARDNGIKGKVFVRFVINSQGDVDQVQIARSVDPILDAEAMRVVKLLNKWTPGKQQGNPVSVWYTVPINFQLSE